MKKKTKKILIGILASILLLIGIVAGVFFMQISGAKKDVREQIDNLPANYQQYASDYLLNEINTYESLSSAKDIRKVGEDIKLFIDGKAFYKENDFPTIYFNTTDSVGNSLEKIDNYVPTQIVFVGNNGQIIKDDNGKIKVRGNSTADAEKKPYNFKFDVEQDLFGFGYSKKWSLLAECLDPTMVRDRVFFTLAKEMGMDYVSDSEYLMVYVDGEYKGAFLLAETADVKDGRLEINLDNGDIAFEYEAEREDEESVYEYTEHGWRFVLNDPEQPTEEEKDNFLDTIYGFDEVVYSVDYQWIRDTIDIESFAKLYLLNEVAKTIDFDYSSVKFYKKDGTIFAGPPWDFDLSSGNYSVHYHYQAYVGDTKEEKAEIMNSYSDMWAQRNLIFNALTDYPQFNEVVQTYFDQYEALFRSVYQDGGIIDQIINEYGSLFESNYASVSEGGAGWDVSKAYSELEKERFSTYEENVQYLKKWMENRINYLKEENNWY